MDADSIGERNTYSLSIERRMLQHADSEPRYVAQTCRYFGISPTAFYRWKKRFDELGEAGLADLSGCQVFFRRPTLDKSSVRAVLFCCKCSTYHNGAEPILTRC